MRTARACYILAALLVLADQATKIAVKGFNLFGVEHSGMAILDSHEIIGDAVRVTYVENPGMAFGLNFDMPLVLSLFSIIAAVALVVLIRRTTAPDRRWLRMALTLILAGAVGNLIDRTFYGVFYDYASLFHGRVVDFIDVDVPDISLFGRTLTRFWVFNIADAAVSVGMVLLIFTYPSAAKQSAATGGGDSERPTENVPVPLGDGPPPHATAALPLAREDDDRSYSSHQPL